MIKDEINYNHFVNLFTVVKKRNYLGMFICYNDCVSMFTKEGEGKFHFDMIHTHSVFLEYPRQYCNRKIWKKTDDIPTEKEFYSICNKLKKNWTKVYKEFKIKEKLKNIEKDFQVKR